MDDRTNSVLERLAVSSLGTCLGRVSRVTGGSWKIVSSSARRDTLASALERCIPGAKEAVAVYFDVAGRDPFVSVMLFKPGDAGTVCDSFLGGSFRGRRPPEEVALLEIGNIVLNAVVSVVSNGLKKALMPSVPRYMRGSAAAIAAEIGTLLDAGRSFSSATVVIDIRSGAGGSESTVLCLIPEELAGQLI